MTRLVLGEFLDRNPDFSFDLLEHVEATQVIGEARAALEEFVRATAAGGPAGDPWNFRRQAIRAVAHGVPAYAGIDWGRPDYQDAIPVIDKSALRGTPERYLNPAFDVERLWSRDTSGTSGPPVRLRYAPDFFAGFQYFSACKTVWHAGLLRDDMLERPVFCLMVAENRYLGDRVWTDPSGYTGMTLRMVLDERDPAAADRILRHVLDYRPAVLSLGPSALAILLDRLGRDAGRLAGIVAVIISGGAFLDDALRHEAERRTGVPVVNAYGMTEIGEIASTCQAGGMHLHEASVIAEVLGDDGRLSRTGHGDLVVSSVMNRAMPLLRYRTGDLVDLVDEPCPCGRRGRRLASLEGRVAPPFRLADGSSFTPTHLNPLFHDFPLRELQVTQTAADRIEVRVEFLEGTGGRAELLAALGRHAREIIGAKVEVQVRETVFIPGEKFQRYRSLVGGGISGQS